MSFLQFTFCTLLLSLPLEVYWKVCISQIQKNNLTWLKPKLFFFFLFFKFFIVPPLIFKVEILYILVQPFQVKIILHLP